MTSEVRHLRLRLAACVCAISACQSSPPSRFADREILWEDPDRRPSQRQPEESYSGLAWDGADQSFFRPIARFLAVDPGGEASNVNALDEVPDSSWFTNRLGRYYLTERQLAMGACRQAPLDPSQAWTVSEAKPDGANPGFIIDTPEGDRYLLKFDGAVQGPRRTAGDVVGSLIYHAAGYHVPCNRLVYFDAERLTIAADATREDEYGDEVALTVEDVREVLAHGLRLPDGRYRAMASLFVEGKPLGPWRYQGTRPDDPNDVVPHEDRREVRAMRLLAAWTNHTDSREQNTLAAWVQAGEERGYVRHYLVDFGDCFGTVWNPPMMGRRLGFSNYFDFHHVPADFFTFGVIERPWDKVRYGASGPVFGYYEVEHFHPEQWQPGYPNPAFSRMTDRDAAWVSRIIAQFTEEHLEAMVAMAGLSAPLARELRRVLWGRRERILREYLARVSPLSVPRLVDAEGAVHLCAEDLEIATGILLPQSRRYQSDAWDRERRVALPPMAHPEPGWICQPLPASPDAGMLLLDLYTGYRWLKPATRLRAQLQVDDAGYRLVGVERD